MRGGTSKGIYLLERDIPPAGAARDAFLLRLMGSPDVKQIDGLGGAAAVTSKIAILSASTDGDIDIEYLFAQVSVDKPMVSYAGNCGNISAAVGPFAVENGFVRASSPTTKVRILNRNTNKVIEEILETPDGILRYDGNVGIPGVPGTGAPIRLRFIDPVGSIFGRLLPTDNVTDVFSTDGLGEITVSVVDVSNPLLFVRAADLGLDIADLFGRLNENQEMLRLLEQLRGNVAKSLGLVDAAQDSAWKTPGVPKLTIVAPPCDYTAADGEFMPKERMDIVSRMLSMQRPHPTYAMTGAMCTAAAAIVSGSVVESVVGVRTDPGSLRIGHPAGIMEARVDFSKNEDGKIEIYATEGVRTARKIMTGTAFC
jgi:2-methylaconitate cis-trans-isomerase PrpF